MMGAQTPLPGFAEVARSRGRGKVRDFTNLTTAEVAAAFGYTPQAVGNWTKTGCPCVKRDGRLYFDLPTVIAWRRARDMEVAHSDDGALLLASESGTTPALEEYRHWKARLAEIEYEQKKENLLDKAELVNQWRMAGSRLRTALENIERRFGRDIGDAIRDAIGQTTRDLHLG